MSHKTRFASALELGPPAVPAMARHGNQPSLTVPNAAPRIALCAPVGCSGEHGSERVEALGHDPVPDPQSALLPGDEPGLEEDLHVVAHRRLRAIDDAA